MFVLKTFIVYFRIALYPEANNEFYIDDQDYEEVGIICSEYNKHIENFQKCLCTKHQSKYVLSFLKNMFNNAQCDVLIGELKYENCGNFNCKLHIITKECEDGNEYGNNDDDDDEQIEEIIGILLLPLFRTDTYHIMIDNKKYIVVPKMDYYEEDDDTNTDTDDDDDIELIYSDDE